jgi:hypothetical protein
MTNTPTAAEVFQREFVPLRGRIIEMAATLDRIARAAGSVEADPRFQQVRRGLDILARREPAVDRAERVQMVFSLPYDPHWRGQAGEGRETPNEK